MLILTHEQVFRNNFHSLRQRAAAYRARFGVRSSGCFSALLALCGQKSFLFDRRRRTWRENREKRAKSGRDAG